MKPAVTIVVATHERPAWLRVELHSILSAAATVKARTRVLVVDDASRDDGARTVCAQLGVDYIRREHNGGVAQTLATGFEAVRSPYYAFWGDDDYMLPRWFGLHLAKIAEGFDVVAGSYLMVDERFALMETRVLPVATFEDLRRDIVACNDGSLVRRSAVASLRPEMGRAMMLTLWLAMAAVGRPFAAIAEPTWLYRRHAHNLSERGRPLDPRFAQLRREAIAEYAA